jgi:phage terminase large subunit
MGETINPPAPPNKPRKKWLPADEYLKKRADAQAAALARPKARYLDYVPRGAMRELFGLHDREIILDGPAGTGKSRGCLEKLHYVSEKYQGARCCLVRKTRKSLTQSGMITFEQRVLPRPDAAPFHTGDQEYRYPKGSIIAVAGLDNPSKLFSSDWDIIFVQQAEELDEDDWQSMLRGLRNWKLSYQQIIGDCNPGPPGHWIRSRAATGALRMLPTRHEDNPELWDAEKHEWTERGRQYLSILDGYTGVLYKRLRLGLWVAAEGMVYEDVWDRAVHVVRRFEDAPLDKDQVPKSWPRYWAVDFGYTNPFAWAAYAEDPDGRLYLYKEIYQTKKTVAEHCQRILEVTKDEPKPRAVICDHDAEDRATFERETGLRTKGAWKAVSAGIQALHERLKPAGDGRPRLFYLENSVVDIDAELLARHEPTSSEAEYEVYVWDTSNNRKRGEEPLKKYDHGKDRDRYLITFLDETWRRSRPLDVAIPVITKSGGQSEDIDLVRPSPWRFGA